MASVTDAGAGPRANNTCTCKDLVPTVGPCDLGPPTQPAKHGLKLKVVLKGSDIYMYVKQTWGNRNL